MASPQSVEPTLADQLFPQLLDLCSRGTLAQVRTFVEAHPGVLTAKNDEDGRLALHRIVTYYVCEIFGDDGYIISREMPPLLEQRAAIVSCLAEANPEALAVQDDEGGTPLHIAASAGCGEEEDVYAIFEVLHGLYPDACGVRSQEGDEGWLPLHSALNRGLRDNTQTTLLESSISQGVDLSFRSLPVLHLAVEADWNPRRDLIQRLLEQEPGSAAIKLPNGKLPLHEFCGKDLSCFFWFDAPEIVRDLIEDYHSALWTPGIGGYLPVHIVLCCNWEYDDSDNDAVDVLQVLIEAYPEGLAHASDAGELPLHTALSRLMQPPRKVIDILLDHHSHAIKQKNHNGCLPLHFSCGVRSQTGR